VPARKRKEATETTVISGGKGSPIRRKTKVMSTVQASDRDAAMWDMRFAKAEMDGEVETDNVGNPYDDDPAGSGAGGWIEPRRRLPEDGPDPEGAFLKCIRTFALSHG
jgi:hypothetical protein